MSEGAPSGSPLGRPWTPPRVSGPLITFLGRTPGATELDDEARAAVTAGYNRGYSEGLAAAATEISQKIRQLDERIQAVSSIASRMAKPLERLDDAAATELAQLAILVGTQLARRELEHDPALLIAIIRDCVVELPIAQREVQVHLHPQDAAAVREHLKMLGAEEKWVLINDNGVDRGGARVVVESSQIDARLENRAAVATQTILSGARRTVSGDVTADIEADGGVP